MLLMRSRTIAVLMLTGWWTSRCRQQSSPVNRPWPPEVQRVSPESPRCRRPRRWRRSTCRPAIASSSSQASRSSRIRSSWTGIQGMGRRDARVRAHLQALEPFSSRLKGRCPRGHEQGRRDGQAHRLRRRSRAGAVAEGPGSGRPRRRTAARVADARHQRRSEDGHEGIDHRSLRPEESASSRTPTSSSGVDNWMHTSESDIQLRLKDLKFEARGRCREANGASRRTTRAASIGTPTSLRCMSISCRRRISRATRRCCARAAATRPCVMRRTTSIRCGRSGRIRHQPRVSVRHRSSRRHLAIHCGVRAADLSRRPSARRAVGQRLRRGTRGQSREPDHHRGRRQDAARTQGARARRVLGLDRRTVPPRVSVQRA